MGKLGLGCEGGGGGGLGNGHAVTCSKGLRGLWLEEWRGERLLVRWGWLW